MSVVRLSPAQKAALGLAQVNLPVVELKVAWAPARAAEAASMAAEVFMASAVCCLCRVRRGETAVSRERVSASGRDEWFLLVSGGLKRATGGSFYLSE